MTRRAIANTIAVAALLGAMGRDITAPAPDYYSRPKKAVPHGPTKKRAKVKAARKQRRKP